MPSEGPLPWPPNSVSQAPCHRGPATEGEATNGKGTRHTYLRGGEKSGVIVIVIILITAAVLWRDARRKRAETMTDPNAQSKSGKSKQVRIPRAMALRSRKRTTQTKTASETPDKTEKSSECPPSPWGYHLCATAITEARERRGRRGVGGNPERGPLTARKPNSQHPDEAPPPTQPSTPTVRALVLLFFFVVSFYRESTSRTTFGLQRRGGKGEGCV